MRPASPSRNTRRRLGLVLILLSSLVLLELTLQAGAFAVWLWHGPAPDVPAGNATDTILCVGDSFTYGLGAPTPEDAYPAQLAVALEQRGVSGWRVVNGGRPGQNSAEVHARLPDQLRQHRPRVVCVLVGINDVWSQPPRVAADGTDAAGAGFRLELRTLRLVRLLGFLRQGGLVRSGGDRGTLAGSWRCGFFELLLQPDGGLRFAGKDGRWTQDGERLDLDFRDGTRMVMRWQAHGAGLAVTPAGALVPLHFEPAPRSQDPEAEARTLEAQRVAFAAGRDRAAGEALLAALTGAGQLASARAVAITLVSDHADCVLAWETLASCWFATGELPLARDAAQRALALLPETATARRAALLRLRVHLHAQDEPVVAVRTILEAFRLDRDRDFAVACLHLRLPITTRAQFQAALAALGASGADPALAPLWEEAEQRGRGGETTLGHNLLAIARQIQGHGAQAVFLLYPCDRPELLPAVQAAAQEAGVKFVPTWPAFAQALAATPRPELYVPDGHCNAAGYRLLAATVAAGTVGCLR